MKVVVYFFILCFGYIFSELSEIDRIEYCRTLDCDETIDKKVCGIRKEQGKETYEYMMFQNECLLLKYGCQVDNESAYGITNIQRCKDDVEESDICPDCSSQPKDPICGIRKDGLGFRVRTFENECQLYKHNCEKEFHFQATDFYYCVGNTSDIRNDMESLSLQYTTDQEDDVETESLIDADDVTTETPEGMNQTAKTIIVVRLSQKDMMNINNTARRFFALTHEYGLPVKKISQNDIKETRRRLIKSYGPVQIFEPYIVIPKNRTLIRITACFHKCPEKCPTIYEPVCGEEDMSSGIPTMMFYNHCFMDAAACKLRVFDTDDPISRGYRATSVLFCLGTQLSQVYRFIPIIRTLQRMGRLRMRGRYHYKFKNMKFFNNYMQNMQPVLMGK